MNEAKDCIRPRSTWLLASLGICLCSMQVGCSSFGGLQSVGTWPPFAHLWERGPGSPSPENDTYAQAMRAHLGLDTKVADAKKRRPAQGEEDRSPEAAERDSGSVAIASADDDVPLAKPRGSLSGVQVTLGSPEPLPGSSSERGRLASAGSSTWRAAGSEREQDAPALAGPALASGEEPSPPDRQAPARIMASAGEGSGPPARAQEPAQFALAGQTEREQAADLEPPAAEASEPPPGPDAKLILTQALAKLQALDSYQVKMQRRERVGNAVQPEEEVLLSIRRKPKAVRLEWTSGSSKGREVIFSPTLDSKMIYVHQPVASAVMPSMKIAVDSPLVMKNSRHTIAEAGFETILKNLQKSKADVDAGKTDGAGLEYKGLEKAAGLDRACHHFVRRTPGGEIWNVYLDPRSMLPRLVVAENNRGDLLERYVYSEIRENPTELASTAAFSPAERWGEGKGLFSRLARAASGSSVPSNNAPATR
jgi:hypothetical protein